MKTITLKTITLKQLELAGACNTQVILFRQTFGIEAEVTPEAVASVAHLFDWTWASQNLLSTPARRAYDEAIAPARKAYDEAIAPAEKAYDEARAPAEKAYDEAIALAEKAYNEALAPARKAYDEARALAFCEAYNGYP